MIKQLRKKLIYGPLSPIASLAFTIISNLLNARSWLSAYIEIFSIIIREFR